MILRIALTLCAGMVSIAPCAHAATDVCLARAADILQALRNGDFVAAAAHFDQRMQAAVDARKLGQVWRQMLPKVGAFDRAATPKAQQFEGATVVETPLHFANSWLTMRVACDASGQVSGLFFVPGSNPAAVTAAPRVQAGGIGERPLDVPSPLGPLPGTLVLPPGNGPFAAVLLVAGSGPQNRDEMVGPNQPFRDLAQGLAAAGIASLRYDKRTLTHGAQMAGSAVTIDDEVTDDALAALHLLGRQSHIDPRHLFVLGHSLGGLMAPRIGQRDAQLAGLILLAAPATFDLDTVLRQMRYVAHVRRASADALDQQMAPIAEARDALAHADPAHPPAGSYFHAPSSYWLSLRGYDAIAVAKTLRIPMLVLQGSADYQVTPRDDFSRWQAAFAHNPHVQLHEYPGLGHLFMAAGNPPSPTDYEKPGHVNVWVIRDIAKWIDRQSHLAGG